MALCAIVHHFNHQGGLVAGEPGHFELQLGDSSRARLGGGFEPTRRAFDTGFGRRVGYGISVSVANQELQCSVTAGKPGARVGQINL